MQRHLVGLSLMVVLSLLAACSDVTAPTVGIISTPVDQLPVSVSYQQSDTTQPTAVPASVIAEADAEYLLLTNIYERVAPSVVNIEADVPENDGSGELTVSRGSGFVYDMQGHIITNAHVINNALAIRVTFNSGYVASGTIVGIDTFSDIGVLQVSVSLEHLRPVGLMSDSNILRVGQRAIAIGNPFGLNSSMSVGIVSGLGRTLRSAELIDAAAPAGFQNPSIIQTDAPINPGNSGGPLLTSQGEVMGINTAIRTDSGVFQGVGFAVPSNTVRRVVPSLIETGSVAYSWMGISVTPEDNGYGVAGLAPDLNLPVDSGVLVRGVTVNSPADKAGIRGGNTVLEVRGQPVCIGGDIIVAVDGLYIDNLDELLTYLIVHSQPGSVVQLLVVRENETFEVPMLLEARPSVEGELRDCAG